MKVCTTRLLLAASLLLLVSSSLPAQTIPGWETKQFAMERLDADRVRLMRQVEVVGVGPNAGQQIFADDLLWNTRTGELSAEGNVLLVSPTGRIAAERVVFNTKTKLGTFYTASGLASLGARAAQDKSMFGTLEPEVMFYGETIEKIGDDRYRITHGGFTTCMQPTPRWDIVSGRATIDLEDYAILRNAVLRVKDVPVFYLPIMYYPIQSDDRATGFLMPSYGNSSYRGQSISNAFFWAVNRSQDVTLFHDWYFTRGQGYGSEYRYVSSGTSSGELKAYRLLENQTTLQSGGSTFEQPERQSFEMSGSMVQSLPAGLQARARVNYFSNLTVHQTYNYDFARAVDGSRAWAGTLTGSWSGLTLNANYSRSEYFYSADQYSVTGTLPSIRLDLSSRQLGRLPLFAAVQSEFSRVLTKSVTPSRLLDYTTGRADFIPTLRASVVKRPYLTVGGTATFSSTYYGGRIERTGDFVADPLARRFLDLRGEVTGPVLSRVYSPQKSWADRLKHSIEPIFAIQHRTKTPPIENIAVVSTMADYVIGDTTTLNYGLMSRILVKPQPSADGTAKSSRELLTVLLQQAYYSNGKASVYDPTYSLSYLYRPASKLSPLQLAVRGAPTQHVTTDFKMEYDTTVGTNKLLGLTIGGGVNTAVAKGDLTWNQRRYGANYTYAPDNFVGGSVTTNTRGGQIGGTFSFNYDLTRDNLVQHRWIGFYNAQCCGITVEYQAFNFPGGDPRFLLSTDRRFNLSFSLAGVGSFSNFFGAFGGGGRRY